MTAPDLSSGACFGHADPDLFFPDEHTVNHMGRAATRQAAAAQAICAGCPVTDLCLAYALDTRSSGVWAGTTTRERAAMIRRPLRRRAAAARRAGA